jgi:hypothetical protein
MKSELLTKLQEKVPYIPGSDEYIIYPENTIEDILRHLLAEVRNDKEQLMTILETMQESP